MNAKTLSNYSTSELKEELKRRYNSPAAKKQRALIAQRKKRVKKAIMSHMVCCEMPYEHYSRKERDKDDAKIKKMLSKIPDGEQFAAEVEAEYWAHRPY